MAYDVRAEIVSGLQRLGHNGLSLIGYVSRAFLEEQNQLRKQQGPKKRTFYWDYIGDLGHVIVVTTKRVYDRIRAQHVFLLGPDGRMILYQVLNEGGYSRLIDRGQVARSVLQEDAVDKMLIEAYGLSNQ